MKIFGFDISIARVKQKALQAVDSWRSGWFRVFEPFSGAFQQNITVDRDSVLSFSAVYACITLIAQDVGKLRAKLVQEQPSGIKTEIKNNPAYSPVLRKPNRFQTRNKFFEQWILSKLIHGNTYALKVRDARGVVTALYILDPCRVTPLVSDDGSVFYRLKTDNLSQLPEEVTVPAREIIHDPMVTLFHPLVGVSPIFACGLAALQGLRIQNNSAVFFGNSSTPGGILTAPGSISDEHALAIKTAWDAAYSGTNSGKVAVLGDGLKFEAMAVNAVDAQLIEQLKWAAETVCSCFHVPPYMIGVGPMPAYNNIQALNLQYYMQATQPLIEQIETVLSEGLEMVTPTNSLSVEFDLDGLLRMDTVTRYDAYEKAIRAGWMKPNEARLKEDSEAVPGGDTPYLQQQNFSLAALNKRDQQSDPFGTATPALPAPAAAPDTEEDPQARAADYVTWIKGYLSAKAA